MRKLFVPACLCLLASAGSIGLESILSRDDFAVVSSIDKKVPTETSPGAIPVGEPVPLPPIRKPVVDRSREEICDTLVKAAQSNDVPAAFFIRLLFQESAFQPGLVSPAGAEGIAQFMPETAASMGLDNPFDPLPAIEASARLLRNHVQQFGNLGLAAAAYNAGPKRIQDWLAKKGKLPQETQGYVKSITGRAAEGWNAAETGSPTVKLPRQAPCQEAAGLLAWNGPEQIPLPPTRTPLKAAAPTTPVVRVAAIAIRVHAAIPRDVTGSIETKKPAESAPPANRVAALSTRSHAAITRHATATIEPQKPGKPSASHDAKGADTRVAKAADAHVAKGGKDAVQLAAGKQKHKKLQMSQR
jgi:hypothetical protein